eukprot:SAG11_NODE_2437_length_3364_cov_10.869525_3_plen_166_part_00
MGHSPAQTDKQKHAGTQEGPQRGTRTTIVASADAPARRTAAQDEATTTTCPLGTQQQYSTTYESSMENQAKNQVTYGKSHTIPAQKFQYTQRQQNSNPCSTISTNTQNGNIMHTNRNLGVEQIGDRNSNSTGRRVADTNSTHAHNRGRAIRLRNHRKHTSSATLI